MTGRSRSVRGHSEAAKGVASSRVVAVAWSIEAAPAGKRAGLVTPNSPRSRLIFKPPTRSSSGLKVPLGQKRAFSAENRGTGAIAPVASEVRQHGALGGVGRCAGHPLSQGGRGPAGGQPEADLQREDRPFHAVNRLVEITPQGDGAEQG